MAFLCRIKMSHAKQRNEELVPSMGTAKGSARLKDVYDGYFEAVLAETDEQRRSAFRLRYEVYCVAASL